MHQKCVEKVLVVDDAFKFMITVKDFQKRNKNQTKDEFGRLRVRLRWGPGNEERIVAF